MIIGITGNALAGKDTVAKLIQFYYLKKENPKCCERLWASRFLRYYDTSLKSVVESNEDLFQIKKFAGKLKAICSELISCRLIDFENQEFKKKDNVFGVTNRKLLQDVGENFKKLFGEDVWVDALFQNYPENEDEKFSNWIISDVRFLNEAKRIKKFNGIIIKVERHRIELSAEESMHRSEIEMKQIIPDFVIDNSGTIENTWFQLVKILDILEVK